MTIGTMHTSLLGQGEGPTVVVLHPLGADGTFWQPLAGHLPGRRVLAVDLPGHGRSPVPDQPYTISEVADALADQLRAAGEQQVHVVGLSIGGLVAADLAARHRDLVAGLVLSATVPTYPPAWREQWTQRAATVRTDGLGAFVEPTLALWLSPQAPDVAPQAEGWVRSVLAEADPAGYALACQALATVDLTDLLPQVTAPTLVVTGALDAELFRDGGRQVAAAVPGARSVVLPGLGHASALEGPEAFADAVDDHLVEVEDGTAT